MPADPSPSAPCTGIRFSNGQQWRLHPTDAESKEVIQRLAEVMQLMPAESGREIFISTARGVLPEERQQGNNPQVCILTPGLNEVFRLNQMSDLAKMIAFQMLPEGGLLLHGALAERDGVGVILAAPGGTGKTTASNRLPPPWHSISDDATLVVPDAAGTYHAHPWPTWSRFRDDGPGGSWPVEKSVPLAALFFLSRSEEDRAEPVDAHDAVAYLTESVHQTTGIPSQPGRTPGEVTHHCEMELAAATALAGAVPAYQLEINLTGTFWEAIDKALATAPARTRRAADVPLRVKGHGRTDFSDPNTGMFGPGHIPVVYTGPSMNPTLVAPDLLDVVPYGNDAPDVGDVICFPRLKDEQVVVHRIIRINRHGITTQGDNNPVADPDVLLAGQVLGKVSSATRGNVTRKIPGGTYGRIVFRGMRFRSFMLQAARKFIHLAKPVVVITRASSRLLPGSMKPHIVYFASRNYGILRLYFGRTLAGEYDPAKGFWTIRLPFRLLVSEAELPAMDMLKQYAPEPSPASR